MGYLVGNPFGHRLSQGFSFVLFISQNVLSKYYFIATITAMLLLLLLLFIIIVMVEAAEE